MSDLRQAFRFLVLPGSCVALPAIYLFASWIPAHRASRVDPIQSLKAE